MLLKVRNENGTFEDVEVIKGEKGQDGAIQYTAGTGIEITSNNVINNTQSGATWGNITGTLSNQTDLNTKFNLLTNSKANRNHQHEMLDITDGFELREAYTQDAYCVYSTTYLNTQLNNKANSTAIPTKTSDLTNDSGYLTQHQDISGKVDKVPGKGLSTNDFTNDDKNKLNVLSNMAYSIARRITNTNQLTFNCSFSSTDPAGDRQTVLIFGSDNNVSICGMLIIYSGTDTTLWQPIISTGTANITASLNANKVVTVTLPTTAYDNFTLISSFPIS